MARKEKKPPKGRQRVSSRGKVIISRDPLHLQVASQLRRRIVSGEIEPGEKIRVNALAAELDVSLTPLREALKVLAGEQLVELTPNRGARVAPLTIEDTAALFEVMAELEALAARLACRAITRPQLQEIEALHAEMIACYGRGDKPGYFVCNRTIHDLVVEASGNPILEHTRGQLAIRAERVRFFSVDKGTDRDEAIDDHEALLKAFRAGDESLAHDVWHRHLQRTGRDVCAVLRAMNVKDAAE